MTIKIQIVNPSMKNYQLKLIVPRWNIKWGSKHIIWLFYGDGALVKFFDPGRVGSAIFGFSLGLENFPLKIPNFSVFSPSYQKNLLGLGQKVFWSKTGWPLNYCRSKVCSGRVRAHLCYFEERTHLLILQCLILRRKTSKENNSRRFFNHWLQKLGFLNNLFVNFWSISKISNLNKVVLKSRNKKLLLFFNKTAIIVLFLAREVWWCLSYWFFSVFFINFFD